MSLIARSCPCPSRVGALGPAPLAAEPPQQKRGDHTLAQGRPGASGRALGPCASGCSPLAAAPKAQKPAPRLKSPPQFSLRKLGFKSTLRLPAPKNKIKNPTFKSHCSPRPTAPRLTALLLILITLQAPPPVSRLPARRGDIALPINSNQPAPFPQARPPVSRLSSCRLRYYYAAPRRRLLAHVLLTSGLPAHSRPRLSAPPTHMLGVDVCPPRHQRLHRRRVASFSRQVQGRHSLQRGRRVRLVGD